VIFERWLVRSASVATFAGGIAIAARASPPQPLPAWALSSRVVYGLAIVLAVVAPVFVLLTLAVQTIVRGRVPTAISRDGLTWAEEVTSNGRAGMADLQLEVDRLAAELDALATHVLANEQW
jgi:hypothetical protein